MTAGFSRVPVSKLVAAGEAELKTGPFGTQLKASDYTDEGTPVINVRNIGFGGIKADKLEHISPSTRDRLSSHILQRGDIVFGRKGAVERHVFIREEHAGWFQGSDCLRLRFISPRVEPLFASYFFLTPEHQRWMMNQCSHGATMASLNQEILERIELPLPTLSVQRRIAGILSAYDDLIENNQRRIKILEEMARSLYREWFVHFRLPGHDKVKVVPSSLGPIPQGWEAVTLKEITSKIGSGATPRGGKEAYKAEGIRLIRSLNVYDYRFEFSDLAFIDEAQAEGLNNVTVATKDILLNITGASVARCCMVPSYLLPARVNQHVSIVRVDPDRADPYYVLDTINSEQRKQQLLAFAQGGATREALTKETIENFAIMLPPRPLLDKYGKSAGALHTQRETLERQCQNLRRTRDLLLPRLLAGQVDIKVL